MPTEAQKRALSYGPQPDIAAASLRAPMRGELLVLSLLTTSKRYTVPDAWKGSFVNFFADGADVFLQFSTADNAVADKNRASAEAGAGPYTLTAHGDECWKIPNGQWLPIPVPASAVSMGAQASVACLLRTHPSET